MSRVTGAGHRYGILRVHRRTAETSIVGGEQGGEEKPDPETGLGSSKPFRRDTKSSKQWSRQDGSANRSPTATWRRS